jgi:hypothetical protein
MSFRVSPSSSRLVKSFNTRTRATDTEAAASAFGADSAGLARPRFLEALNAISGVLHGTIELSSVKQSTLEAMCSAFHIELPEDEEDDPEVLLDLLQPRFYGAEEVRALMDTEIDSAPLPILLFWADELNLEVSAEASREDVRDLISRARHGLDRDDAVPVSITRKRKLDRDTLLVCETEELRRLGHALRGEGFAHSSSRRELIEGLLDTEVDENLLSGGGDSRGGRNGHQYHRGVFPDRSRCRNRSTHECLSATPSGGSVRPFCGCLSAAPTGDAATWISRGSCHGRHFCSSRPRLSVALPGDAVTWTC